MVNEKTLRRLGLERSLIENVRRCQRDAVVEAVDKTDEPSSHGGGREPPDQKAEQVGVVSARPHDSASKHAAVLSSAGPLEPAGLSREDLQRAWSPLRPEKIAGS
jgi:hypothetical protein